MRDSARTRSLRYAHHIPQSILWAASSDKSQRSTSERVGAAADIRKCCATAAIQENGVAGVEREVQDRVLDLAKVRKGGPKPSRQVQLPRVALGLLLKFGHPATRRWAHIPSLNHARNDIGAIFVSLELSRSKWLITSLSPGGGERMSKHTVPGGDICALLARFSELQRKALARTGTLFPVIVVQEAGLDGFSIHRLLEKEGIESHVVDAASIAVARRRRRAKTDGIDGETLLRTLLAYKRNEPRVCAMVKLPAPRHPWLGV